MTSRTGADKRPAILIVDDDPDILLNLAPLLEMEGFAAEVAFSGPAAIAALEVRRFKVVILDITLQHIDGVHIARFMRKRFPNVRIAVHSGSTEAEIRTRFDDYDAFLLKSEPAGRSENRPLAVSCPLSRPSTSTPPTSCGSVPVTSAAYATLASRPASENAVPSPK